MRSRYLLALAFSVCSVCATGQTDEQRTEDASAIKAVIDKRTADFNARDVESQAMLFTQDADFYGSAGDIHAKGRDDIASLLGTVLRGPFRNATLRQTVTKLTYISTDAAVATLDVEVERPSKDGKAFTRTEGC